MTALEITFAGLTRALTPPPARELWRPDRDEQMAAIEVLMASSISTELRDALREREAELSRGRA